MTSLRSKLSANYSKGAGYYFSGDVGEASHFIDNNGWLTDDPFDCRRANWSPANNALFLGPMIDGTVNVGPSGLPLDAYTCLSSNFENPICFNGIFPTTVDYPFLVASPSTFPTLEPFLEGGSDGTRSSSSSPSSTYSTLYTTDFNDDVASLSLANNVSQEPPLYNIM